MPAVAATFVSKPKQAKDLLTLLRFADITMMPNYYRISCNPAERQTRREKWNCMRFGHPTSLRSISGISCSGTVYRADCHYSLVCCHRWQEQTCLFCRLVSHDVRSLQPTTHSNMIRIGDGFLSMAFAITTSCYIIIVLVVCWCFFLLCSLFRPLTMSRCARHLSEQPENIRQIE